MHAAVAAVRERVTNLLLGLGGPERQHRHLAAVVLHEPHRLLDPALLVRRDHEAEVARLERLLVGRQDLLAAGERHALDADEDPHAGTGAPSRRAALTRALSGSSSAAESF